MRVSPVVPSNPPSPTVRYRHQTRLYRPLYDKNRGILLPPILELPPESQEVRAMQRAFAWVRRKLGAGRA